MSVIWDFIEKNSNAIAALVEILSVLMVIGRAWWRFFVKFLSNRRKRKKEKEIYKMYASLIDADMKRRRK